MAVRTATVTSASGYVVGSLGAAKERLENVDFLRVAFDSFDVDKSGFLDPQELRAALTMLGVRSSRAKQQKALEDMGVEDRDGDCVVSLQDLDKDGDEKIDFEEFKVFAAVLPKRDHAIYRNALAAKPITLKRDERQTPVQKDQYEAQQKCKEALNNALANLRKKLNLTSDKKVMKDSLLRQKFDVLDKTGDARVELKELIAFLQSSAGDTTGHDLELAKSEAWLLMNCADANNDKVMTFDEFKRMMQTVALGV